MTAENSRSGYRSLSPSENPWNEDVLHRYGETTSLVNLGYMRIFVSLERADRDFSAPSAAVNAPIRVQRFPRGTVPHALLTNYNGVYAPALFYTGVNSQE